MGKPIPAYINRAAYLGSFLSCLLPSDAAAQAPVGDPNAGGNQANVSAHPRRSDFIYSPFAGKSWALKVKMEHDKEANILAVRTRRRTGSRWRRRGNILSGYHGLVVSRST